MRAAHVLPCLGLAACAATISTADPMPTRRDVADALVASLACVESEAVVCHNQPLRATLSRLRCIPHAQDDRAGRVLCRYAGRMSWADGRRGPIASECAYLARAVERTWRIDYYPDADVCDF